MSAETLAAVALSILAALVVGFLMHRRGAPASVEQQEHEHELRRLPVYRVKERVCANCRHFDLEAGQAFLRRQPVFMTLVAPYIAPSEYGETVDESGETIKPNIPGRCQWKDFGQCGRHDDGVWAEMSKADRLSNFKDWTAEGDCWEPRT